MRQSPTPPRLLDDGAAVEIELQGRPLRFHALWLRDNAQDPGTRSPSNGQRLVTLLDLPGETRIADAEWSDGALRVRFEPEAKVVSFDAAWLIANAYDKPAPAEVGWTPPDILRWDAALAAEVPVDSYAEVNDDRAIRMRWLRNLRRYGFARMSNVPIRPGVAAEIAQLFGYVRETNYGRLFDVRAEINASNLAYTNLGLQAHTDNPYRDPTPGLQILVCHENTVEGGGSVLVDGFKAAERLQAESPRGFGLLASHCARFEFAGTVDVRLRSKRPILELAPDGELVAIRFNNRSAAPFSDIPYAEMGDYYAAYRRLAELIGEPDLSLRFRLEPGELFVVDNLRVLHAREAFAGSGTRWLQGCYVDRDGMLSTLAALEEEGL